MIYYFNILKHIIFMASITFLPSLDAVMEMNDVQAVVMHDGTVQYFPIAHLRYNATT